MRPAIRNAGVGGAVRFRPDTKSGGGGGGGGGGAARFRPDMRSGGGGGGGGCLPFKARYEKRRRGGGGVLSGASGPMQNAGKGRGCLAEEGALPYMKGGVATPKPPPPPPPHLGSASEVGCLWCGQWLIRQEVWMVGRSRLRAVVGGEFVVVFGVLYGEGGHWGACDVCASVAHLAADCQLTQDMSCSVKVVRSLVAAMASGGSAVRAGGLSANAAACRSFN